MLEEIYTIITKLQNTNSQNEKLFILAQHKNNKDFIKFLKYCYDTNLLFGVTSDSLKKNPNLSTFEIFEDIFELCDLLINKKYTGNDAISLVNGFINGNNMYEEMLYNFFDKNLKIGINVTQINKVLGNIIPIFDVALAETYEEKKASKYNLNEYFIQRKCNGLRMITFITFNNEDGNTYIKFLSRKGKEFTTMSKIETELRDLYKNSHYYGTNIVLDGEICIIDPNGKEDWNRAVSEAKRKDHTIYNPMYICFDILTQDEFYGLSDSRKYEIRYMNLKKFLSVSYKLNHIQLIFSIPYTIDHYHKLLEEFVETDKWEGFIYRHNTKYYPGRTSHLLKYKLFKDAEFEVKGTIPTTKQMLNDKGIMEDTPCVGALLIDYKGHSVSVGSGLSDKQRIDWFKDPSLIVHKTILVKYKEETKNQDGTISLQFPVLKYIYEDKRDF